MPSEDKKPKQEGQQGQQRRSNKYKRRGGNKRFYRRPNTNNSKTKGRTEELDGYIYDVGTNTQAQLFADTTREIAEYAGRTLKEAQDIRTAIEELEDTTLVKPTKETTGDPDEIAAIYKIELDAYYKRLNAYRQNKATMYSIVLG